MQVSETACFRKCVVVCLAANHCDLSASTHKPFYNEASVNFPTANQSYHSTSSRWRNLDFIHQIMTQLNVCQSEIKDPSCEEAFANRLAVHICWLGEMKTGHSDRHSTSSRRSMNDSIGRWPWPGTFQHLWVWQFCTCRNTNHQNLTHT